MFIYWLRVSSIIFVAIFAPPGLQLLFDCIYGINNRRKPSAQIKLFSILSFSNFLDLLITIAFFYNSLRIWLAWAKDLMDPFFYSHLHNVLFIETTLALAMFLLWGRLIWAIRLTRPLGPFVKSLTRIFP